ncbi:DUF6090 family protein [Robiginitalea sp. IMCC44478]|uniref:DUF6090 family protein n=1 Tax=Robiginitalea sp. IMCC44478 TaxID=3459122 RepID=UPI0040415338
MYAVGEILLVVIGILIAIQVDNWNEKRIKAENNKILFQEVSEELVQNIEEIDKIINTYLVKDSLYFIVFNKKVDYEDYKKTYNLFGFTHLWMRTNLMDGDYQELLAGKNNLTELQDSILSELRDLYGRRKLNADKDDEEIAEYHFYQRMKWMDELPWSSDYLGNGIITDEMIQFALTDPFYLNEVIEIHNRERGHLGGMLWFRTKALDLYKEIMDMLLIEKDTSLVKDFKNFKHVLGVYEGVYGRSGVWKGEINEKKESKIIWYNNGTKYGEWNIHPYSKNYLIFYAQEKNENFIYKIELDKNGEVLGLSLVGDLIMDKDGNKRMMKKIE